MQDIRARATNIRLVIFDVDGVLTDGSLYLGEHGEEYKAFHSRDGHGMVMLHKSGVRMAVITGRDSPIVTRRMDSLGVERVYQGCRDKLLPYLELKKEFTLSDTEIAYIGDDVVDLPVMHRVGLAIAVADAHPRVRQDAHWCASLPGGRGAVREACELIMEAQGTLEPILEEYR